MSARPQPPRSAGAGATLTVELWLDIGCPWCYLGRHRLERAIEAAAPDRPVELVLRSFELNPGMSTTPVPVPEYLAGAFAGTVERAREADGQVAALAHADGLPYTTERTIANSFDVHRVLHLARTHGVATPMFRALQAGYFAGDLDPYDPATLVRVAAEAGVPADEASAVSAGTAFGESVRREQQQGRALGITGVPFTVMGGVSAVAGAQDVERYRAALQTALTAAAA